MATLGPEGRKLNAALVDLTDLLICYGVDEWGARLRGERSAFERGHDGALDRLRASLSGPGSLEGFVIEASAGHDVAEADAQRVNARLVELRTQCVELAAAVTTGP